MSTRSTHLWLSGVRGFVVLAGLSLAGVLWSATAQTQAALTIYNQNFGVIREQVPLDLHAGINAVLFTGVTAQLEPDSVVLRDPSGRVALHILEQSYRADAVSQGLMLSLFEGRVIDFLAPDETSKFRTVSGEIIRSGYVPGSAQEQADGDDSEDQPIVKVAGQLRFSLPGEPIFPQLADDSLLKPQLVWQLESSDPAKFNAELSYVTGGLSWEASYNLIAAEKGDKLDLVGWVTMTNHSGRTFENASIKLMAGDTNKLVRLSKQPTRPSPTQSQLGPSDNATVTEKAFDEFHLYSLPRPVTFRDQETKQVEFIRALNVSTIICHEYDGFPAGTYGGTQAGVTSARDYGAQSVSEVALIREFENSETNGLGLPLPKGTVRFYRRNSRDGQLEFAGESRIDHTAKNEKLRLSLGDALDLTGDRKQTAFLFDHFNNVLEESFEIKVRSGKSAPVEVRIKEHLYRWGNWTILTKSNDFVKTDAQEIEFRVAIPADGEQVVSYTVRYDWK